MDLHADFLIIGSGIAGLRAAVELAGAGSVLILTKAEPREGNTGYAQGGIAAAVGSGDSPALHAADTIAAGDGLCDPRAVQVLVEEGPGYVRELMDVGRGVRSRARRCARAGDRGRAQRASRAARARRDRARDRPRALASRVGTRGRPDIGSRARRRARDDRWKAEPRAAPARASCTRTGRRASRARASCCSRPAAPDTSTATRPIPRSLRATAWRWPTGQAPRFRISSSSSFIPTALKVPGQPTIPALGGAARRRRAAPERERRGLHAALRSGRRSRAPRSRRPQHRARTPANRCAGVPLARASGPGLRARAVSLDLRARAGRQGSISRATASRSGPPRTTSWAAWRPISTAGRRSTASSPQAKWPAPASTAPTGSPATRCSRGSCSGPARARHARAFKRFRGSKGSGGSRVHEVQGFTGFGAVGDGLERSGHSGA